MDRVAVDIFAPGMDSMGGGLFGRQVAQLGQLYQHGQIGAVKDDAISGRTGRKRQVRGRTTENIGYHDHPIAFVDLVGGDTNLAAFFAAIMIILDGDGADAR